MPRINGNVPLSDMDANRRAAFPNTEPAHCVHGCGIANYCNKIIESFYDPNISDDTLRDRARRAMGLRQECPRRRQNRPCRAMAFKHLLLMRILNQLPNNPEPPAATPGPPVPAPAAEAPAATPPEPQTSPIPELATLRITDDPERYPDAAGDTLRSAAPTESSTPIRKKQPTLSCPVCFDSLIETSEPILALDCGHIVCHECFIPMLEEEDSTPDALFQDLSEDEDTLRGFFLPCPVCRKRCKKPRRLFPLWRD